MAQGFGVLEAASWLVRARRNIQAQQPRTEATVSRRRRSGSISMLYRTATQICGCIASSGHLFSQISSSIPICMAGRFYTAFVGLTFTRAARYTCKVLLTFKDWWNPPRRGTPANSAKPARALGRRRQPMTLEPVGGGSSSTIVVHVNPPRRPRQSLQQTQQHRGHLPVRPPAHQLPRIDVHVQFTRQSQRTVGKFHQYFRYDSGSAAMQAIIEDIYDNPVSVIIDGKIERAPLAQQPDSVVHRLHWQGQGGLVGEVLNEALGKLLTNLSINHCSVALSDVVAILAEPLPLDSLEVHKVVANGETNAHLPLVQRKGRYKAGSSISSLAVTSCVELDDLFESVNLPGLASLSLWLHGMANKTRFELLPSAAFGPSTWAKERRMFTLRGQLVPVAKAALETWLKEGGVGFSYEHIVQAAHLAPRGLAI